MNAAHQINIAENTVAILFNGKIEIYSVDSNGLETFSHYARGKEYGTILMMFLSNGGL